MRQIEFKETHKNFDTNKQTMSRPGAELKSELSQLEDERRQLKDRIERLQASTRNEIGFPGMLAATSAMRQEQDEEVRLGEKMREQKHMLDLAEQRCQETQRRLQVRRKSTPIKAKRAARQNTLPLCSHMCMALPPPLIAPPLAGFEVQCSGRAQCRGDSERAEERRGRHRQGH